MRSATPGPGDSTLPEPVDARERRAAETWRLIQALTSLALGAALVDALVQWIKLRERLPLSAPQQIGLGVLIVAGLVFFVARGVVLGLRWMSARGGSGSPS